MTDVSKPWFVYIILGTDQHLYTGITTNVARRWSEHTSGKLGAKYFRGRQPQALCFLETAANRSLASKREHALKMLMRRDKIKLIQSSLTLTTAIIAVNEWGHLPQMTDSPLELSTI